jgi:hypothetical protein
LKEAATAAVLWARQLFRSASYKVEPDHMQGRTARRGSANYLVQGGSNGGSAGALAGAKK